MQGRQNLLYQGKDKSIFQNASVDKLVLHFHDMPSTADSQKEAGSIYNLLSGHILEQLSNAGIPTHFIKRLNMREQLIKPLEILPLTLRVRNIASASFAKKFSMEPDVRFSRPIIEYASKFPGAAPQFLTQDHIIAMGLASTREISEIEGLALRANDFLQGFFSAIQVKLYDFTLEIGREYIEEIEDIVMAIGDEITSRTCALEHAIPPSMSEGNSSISSYDLCSKLHLLPKLSEKNLENTPSVHLIKS